MLRFVLTYSYPQQYDKSNTFIIITIKNITCSRSNKFQDTIFENSKRVGSKLFRSMIAEGKREFVKKLCLILKQGILSRFLETYAWFFSGISLKRYWGLLFL